jgi:hypothetical protein
MLPTSFPGLNIPDEQRVLARNRADSLDDFFHFQTKKAAKMQADIPPTFSAASCA